MDLSTKSKEDFARFGCTVEFGEACFYIDLRNFDKDHLAKTTILVRALYTKWVSTPLFCLTFEVSPNRPLARYCYYPFDLTNSAAKDFLTRLTELGELNIGLVAADGNISGKKKLREWQVRHLRNTYAQGITDIQGRESYDFAVALNKFESSVRLPQVFDRVMSDHDIPKFIHSVKNDAEKIVPEKRVAAQEVCSSFAQVWKANVGSNITAEQIQLIYTIRGALLLSVELHREFGDFDQLTNFLADIIATNVQDIGALKKAMKWSPRANAALKLFNLFSSAFESNQKGVRSSVVGLLEKTLGDVASGRQLSMRMLQGLLIPFQPFLFAQPGRRTKDYSREYEWKHTMSWTQVARKSLEENSEIRQEFGGRLFKSLSFQEQTNLRKRIIEGVRSWAEKNQKPFPIPSRVE